MLKSPIHISSPDLSLIFRFMYLTNYLTPLFRYLVIPQTYHVQTSSVLSLLQRVSASPTASAFSRDLNSICHSFRPSELSYTFSLSAHIQFISTARWLGHQSIQSLAASGGSCCCLPGQWHCPLSCVITVALTLLPASPFHSFHK